MQNFLIRFDKSQMRITKTLREYVGNIVWVQVSVILFITCCSMACRVIFFLLSSLRLTFTILIVESFFVVFVFFLLVYTSDSDDKQNYVRNFVTRTCCNISSIEAGCFASVYSFCKINIIEMRTVFVCLLIFVSSF